MSLGALSFQKPLEDELRNEYNRLNLSSFLIYTIPVKTIVFFLFCQK